ncbi:uncharacterized protein LOC124366487 [Homalodisca vitripennis]|uniref:uncharacterized protein LOC124366487 n=1 Tax=Homalodisca vitripennis TaxID=197043 RepID=UPI001EEB0B5D|nr:uncharacterized protein LOC124366487 [Homalodisca vitripennis]
MVVEYQSMCSNPVSNYLPFPVLSTEAALVISGTVPIKLQVEKRIAKRKGVLYEEEHYTRQWQEAWSQDTGKAAWTKRLIPDIRPWISRTHGQCSYYLTQVLSGHGCFGYYKRRFALSDTDA